MPSQSEQAKALTVGKVYLTNKGDRLKYLGSPEGEQETVMFRFMDKQHNPTEDVLGGLRSALGFLIEQYDFREVDPEMGTIQ